MQPLLALFMFKVSEEKCLFWKNFLQSDSLLYCMSWGFLLTSHSIFKASQKQ